MTNALMIDTSSTYCSVALQCDGQQFARHEELGRRHNERVLEMLDGLFDEAGVAALDIDVVGFNAGPGSFTGVRIAAAITQAIAYAADAEVVGVPSARAVVQSLGKDMFLQPGWVVSWPSRADLYYLSAYACSDAGVVLRHSDQLSDSQPDWAAQLMQQGWGLTGSMAPWLETRGTRVCEIVPEARAQLEYVLAQFSSGLAKPPELALPVYLPEDSPWRASAKPL